MNYQKPNHPLEILDEYWVDNKLTRLTEIEVNENEKNILIKNIEARTKLKGYCCAFLIDIKNIGYSTSIELPRKKALGFWQKMFKRGLINNDPDTLETWE